MPEILDIEKMSYGPDSVAHLPTGKTVFVEGAVAGDVAEVEICEEKPSFARGRAIKIIEPSKFRAEKLPKGALECEASWAELDYSYQLNAKRDNVFQALLRTAHLDEARINSLLGDIVPNGQQWGYRNKIELAAFRDAQQKFSLGMHKASSDEIIKVDNVPLANSMLAQTPKALTGFLRYLQGNQDFGIFRVGLRASENTKSLEAAIWTTPSPFPRKFSADALKESIGATSVVRVIADEGKARRVKRVEVLEGKGYWREVMMPPSEPKCKFQVSAPSFFQVNTQQAAKLVQIVLDAIDVQPREHVVDVFCGVGTFSIPAALKGARVDGIEIAGSSTRDLERNARENGVFVDVVCDDAKYALAKIDSADALIVDPPRCGLDKGVISAIANMGVSRFAYVSCDVQTLARDIARFERCGFRLGKVTPVDMFPQTFHVENVALFQRM